MTTEELFNLTANCIIEKIRCSKGLAQFARKRAKFEGWLKVEFVNSLVVNNYEAQPEVDNIDVLVNNEIGIELKTISTNYRYEGCDQRNVNITQSVQSIMDDIEKLNGLEGVTDKFVVFIVFPVTHGRGNWQQHFEIINEELQECLHKEFGFSNGIPGVIYYGKVRED